MFRLDGKVALVTGAGSGLGVGIVTALARQGASVIVNDLDPAKAEATAVFLREGQGRAIAAPFDVTDRAAADAAIAKASGELGPIDILVNNAGNAGGHQFHQLPFAQMPPENWDRFIDVNLVGVLNCTHAVVGGMEQRGWGRVITISSTAGRVGASINVSIYGAAKAGAAHFMRHLSQEVAAKGVTANVISLGFMNTVGEEFAKAIIPTIPTKRCGTGEDVGAAVVYLASQEASWVTGATLVVDGGSTPFSP
jgi:NAD(P)-dependent dehydrogenase (short-subunit alcohol dehydrogenase family)